MKRTVFIMALSVLSVSAFAQKQTFDIVSYALPGTNIRFENNIDTAP